MNKTQRIQALTRLGHYIAAQGDYLQAVMKRTEFNNKWFTIDNQKQALTAIATEFLEENKLRKWIESYDLPEVEKSKSVGLVMAGNIPLVGFHDMLCVFAAGHKSLIKLSDKDRFLLPHLLDKLKEFDAQAADYFEIVERIQSPDAVIATGSNNSARYFEAYFGKYPHIIRKNRNGVAVLTGEETETDLRALGEDIFRYYGLGCRNVSKIYVPEGYDFNLLMETLHEFNYLVNNSKYKNNFDYNIALFQLNAKPIMNNGSIILTEDKTLTSRIAMLHWEYYADLATLEKELLDRKEEIQLVTGNVNFEEIKTKKLGEAQSPRLNDYADGIDTMAWLKGLSTV